MGTKEFIISSAKKDLKRAKDKLDELLDFNSHKECFTNLGEQEETIKEITNEIEKLKNKLGSLVKK